MCERPRLTKEFIGLVGCALGALLLMSCSCDGPDCGLPAAGWYDVLPVRGAVDTLRVTVCFNGDCETVSVVPNPALGVSAGTGVELAVAVRVGPAGETTVGIGNGGDQELEDGDVYFLEIVHVPTETTLVSITQSARYEVIEGDPCGVP